ncbi:unnamed protein product [Vitrella brassicaformis CCMP3155]|uniref:J domain-containing protein n=1 Tax=Vitrella brassicaformis (strain CCMP3155) TaxID=1169540 RepID=A0A0G4EJU7_VITBC|nr:unnamed protein product [Vitrella brassicaformis CCMP3155]|eukprot:CEL97027.1 unnamed protein product [Vitrella brassicaformis CCMP3155]
MANCSNPQLEPGDLSGAQAASEKLGVAWFTEFEEAKKAYRKKALSGEYKHPDKGGDGSAFVALKEARDLLERVHKWEEGAKGCLGRPHPLAEERKARRATCHELHEKLKAQKAAIAEKWREELREFVRAQEEEKMMQQAQAAKLLLAEVKVGGVAVDAAIDAFIEANPTSGGDTTPTTPQHTPQEPSQHTSTTVHLPWVCVCGLALRRAGGDRFEAAGGDVRGGCHGYAPGPTRGPLSLFRCRSGESVACGLHPFNPIDECLPDNQIIQRLYEPRVIGQPEITFRMDFSHPIVSGSGFPSWVTPSYPNQPDHLHHGSRYPPTQQQTFALTQQEGSLAVESGDYKHPDKGGDGSAFVALKEARDLLERVHKWEEGAKGSLGRPHPLAKERKARRATCQELHERQTARKAAIAEKRRELKRAQEERAQKRRQELEAKEAFLEKRRQEIRELLRAEEEKMKQQAQAAKLLQAEHRCEAWLSTPPSTPSKRPTPPAAATPPPRPRSSTRLRSPPSTPASPRDRPHLRPGRSSSRGRRRAAATRATCAPGGSTPCVAAATAAAAAAPPAPPNE